MEFLAARVVCRDCGHWSIYSREEFQSYLAPDYSRAELPTPASWIVTIECGEEGCGSLTRWYFRDTTNASSGAAIDFVCNGAIPQITCAQGHDIQGSLFVDCSRVQ